MSTSEYNQFKTQNICLANTKGLHVMYTFKHELLYLPYSTL